MLWQVAKEIFLLRRIINFTFTHAYAHAYTHMYTLGHKEMLQLP